MLTLGRDFENFGSDNIWIWHSGWRLQQRSCALLSPFTVKVKRIKNREKNDTSAIKVCNNPKAVNNWIISDISRILNETETEPMHIPFDCNQLGKLVILIDKGVISTSIGKKVLEELFENPRDPEEIIKEKGWIQISDEGEIKKIVLEILEANPQSIVDYKAGKDRALGFLVGQAMKATKGKANPKMLNEMFLEELKK